MDRGQRIICAFSAFAVSFCLVLPAAAQSAETAKPNPMDNPAVKSGQTLFKTHCQACHGQDATGGIGPNLMNAPSVHNPRKLKGVTQAIISQGRTSLGMPAFGSQLSTTQINDITAYLEALYAAYQASGGGEKETLQRLLVGNAEAGKQYFNGKGGCSRCHSPTGDLAGIAKKMDPEALQAQFLYPRKDNVTATVTLSSGKQEEGKLLHLDPFYVAIQNKEGWYRSWPRQNVKVQVHDPLAGHMELLHQYTDKDIHNVFAYLETLK
jgi:cytochrome c oxidase cbb3-type subunit 3